jgi:hypothetical protein
MRALATLALFACHASEPAVVPPPIENKFELPKVEAAQPVVTERPQGPGRFTMFVDFAALRAHPAAAQLSTLVPLLPVWRQFLSGSQLDVMRDCDWMNIEGTNVHDVNDDAVFVHYNTSDAAVENAVLALVSQRFGSSSGDATIDLGEPKVRAWQVYMHGITRAFMRPINDHLVAVAPMETATSIAHALAKSPASPPEHGDHAVDIAAVNPHQLVPLMPAAFMTERIWIAGAGGGATMHVEGNCPDQESARAAAIELEQNVRTQNTFAVKLVTHGAFNGFQAEARGALVVADQTFSPDQVNAVLKMTATAQGASVP